MKKEEYMDLGAFLARVTSYQDIGGPFGAVVVKDGEVISVASNTVLRDKDPTAHAEINAIREACKKLRTYDLTGCELYATGYPCPMCLSAIIWANIKKVYYCNEVKEAEKIGFRDDFIYDYIKNGNPELLDLQSYTTEAGMQLYDEYVKMNKTIY